MLSAKQQPLNIKHGGAIIRPIGLTYVNLRLAHSVYLVIPLHLLEISKSFFRKDLFLHVSYNVIEKRSIFSIVVFG